MLIWRFGFHSKGDVAVNFLLCFSMDLPIEAENRRRETVGRIDKKPINLLPSLQAIVFMLTAAFVPAIDCRLCFSGIETRQIDLETDFYRQVHEAQPFSADANGHAASARLLHGSLHATGRAQFRIPKISRCGLVVF